MPKSITTYGIRTAPENYNCENNGIGLQAEFLFHN